MALAGSLREFGLADILQLISYQKKTGNLTLKGRHDTVRVLFREGNIVAAESAKRRSASRLGRVLLRKGAVTAEAMKQAVEEQKGSRLKLGTILVRKGLVSKEQVQGVLTEQVTELIVQLFSWTEGRYEFTPVAIPVDKDVPLFIDTQGLMMDSLRIFDEWSVFKGRVAQNSVFVRTEKPDDGLGKEDLELLAFLDGEKDLSMVADQYGIDAFEAAKRFSAFLDSGLIAPKEAALPEQERAPRAGGPSPIPGLSYILLAVALVALAISILSYNSKAVNELGRVRAAEELGGLRFQVELRRRIDGQYPASVGKTDAWGRPYAYERTEGGFTLVSPGPDGRAGTADDLR